MATNANEFYLKRAGRIDGPFTRAEIGRQLETGHLAPDDLISIGEELAWAPVRQLFPLSAAGRAGCWTMGKIFFVVLLAFVGASVLLVCDLVLMRDWIDGHSYHGPNKRLDAGPQDQGRRDPRNRPDDLFWKIAYHTTDHLVGVVMTPQPHPTRERILAIGDNLANSLTADTGTLLIFDDGEAAEEADRLITKEELIGPYIRDRPNPRLVGLLHLRAYYYDATLEIRQPDGTWEQIGIRVANAHYVPRDKEWLLVIQGLVAAAGVAWLIIRGVLWARAIRRPSLGGA